MKLFPFVCILAFCLTGYGSPGDAPEILQVVSYNIQARPILDHAARKIPAIGKRLTAFDLIGIQELFVCSAEFSRAVNGMNFRYFEPRSSIFKIVNSGLGILSKHPIEETAQEYFEIEGSLQNRLGSKGIFLARIRIAGEMLDFYTTHLAAGREKDSGAARKAQTEQILRFIRQHSPPDRAVILTGDFNWKWRKLRLFSKIGLHNAAQKLHCEKNTHIDHIFYRSGKKLQLIPQQWSVLRDSFASENGERLSDHDPVLAVFQLQSPPSPPESGTERVATTPMPEPSKSAIKTSPAATGARKRN